MSSLSGRPPLPPQCRPGVSSVPPAENITEFRGVTLEGAEGLMSLSERSQSSEDNESEESVNVSLEDMIVTLVVGIARR